MFQPFSPIFKTPFFVLEEAKCATNSSFAPYYRISGPDSVLACILDERDRFVMVKQSRPNLQTETMEMPAGAIEVGETPIQAVRREIREEVGLTCSLLQLGKHFSTMMNRTSIKDFLFFGMHPSELPSVVLEDGLSVSFVPRSNLREMALSGEFIQLGGLGLLSLASSMLSVDIWHDSYQKIESAFSSRLAIEGL